MKYQKNQYVVYLFVPQIFISSEYHAHVYNVSHISRDTRDRGIALNYLKGTTVFLSHYTPRTTRTSSDRYAFNKSLPADFYLSILLIVIALSRYSRFAIIPSSQFYLHLLVDLFILSLTRYRDYCNIWGIYIFIYDESLYVYNTRRRRTRIRVKYFARSNDIHTYVRIHTHTHMRARVL